MIKIDLKQLGWSGKRRAIFRPIVPTQALENELYSIYYDSIRQWVAFTSTLVEEYNPATALDGFIIDADGTQIQWLVDQKARQIENTIVYQTEKLGRWVTKVGTWHGAKTISAAQSATGVSIKPFIKLADVRPFLNQSIRQNVSLISNMNADTKARVEQVLYDAFANRRNKKWLTDELSKAMGITKRRARNIAGDQTHKLNSQLTQYRNEELGITSYIWKTREDGRVRPAHITRQDHIFEWSKPPYDGHPGYPVNCRCSAAAVLDPDDGD